MSELMERKKNESQEDIALVVLLSVMWSRRGAKLPRSVERRKG
jgi:hypothetical protein